MKNFFYRGASLLMPMVFTALIGAAQVVTDPSDTPGYDEAKMTASRSTASGPGASMQLRASTSSTARTGLPDASAPMAAASSCFIPRDASYTAIARNDDGSFGPIALPFSFDLYGASYSQVWINTNGNLTFTGAYSAYSASGFPFTMPMVAGFWGDVDTRNAASGQIYYKLSATNLIVTWDGVGYYSSLADKKNTFQIIIGSATDALLGPASNVSLRYGDMQWTTGSASGGSGGFGGTPATVGVNKGTGSQYVQIGRFGLNSAAYDGPGGATDGVNYLDGQCFGFQVSNAGNIPPSVSGMPSGNTITVACGQTVTVRPQFLAPEVNQTVTVTADANGLCGTNITTTNGATANAAITITGSQCNVGTHTINLSATDNGVPAATTTATLTVVVTSCCNVQLGALASAVSCPGGADGRLDLTVSNATAPLSYAWSNGSTVEDPSGLPAGTYSVTVTDANGCTASGTYTVGQEDTVTPTVLVRDYTLSLDASGNATLTLADVDNGSFDNCAFNLGLNRTAFSCADLGPNPVTLTGTDAAGHSASATATVTVVDGLAPSASAQNLTVQLDANGQASVSAAQVNNGSSDNCGIASMTVAPSTFTCANVGTNDVTLTVTDGHGNVSTAAATVTVVDAIAPTAVAQNVTVQLDANGAASITAAQVDNGSADNCGVASVTVAPSSFGCANLGSNPVTLTVTDVNGNVSTAAATVTVQDNIAPTFSQCPANISVTAQPGDCTPAVSWTAPVAADNCSVTVTSSHQPGARFAVGTTVVMYTVTDRAGNAAACSFSVTVTPTPVVVTLSSPTYAGGFNIGCYGSSTGAATAAVSGGCQPYRYQWSNGQTNATATNLAAGTYSVTVTDANNTSVVRSLTLTQPSPLALSTSYSPQATFQGANTATIYLGYGQQSLSLSASTSGGVAGYTYSWSPATGLSATTGAGVTAAPTATTTYTVTATDQNGCTVSRSFTVRVVDARCGTKGNPNKVIVCHNGHEICVDDSAVPAHLAHGCYVGPCGSNTSSRSATSAPAGSLSRLQVEAAPNPNRGTFGVQVRAASAAPTQADLYDLQGRLVARLFSGALQASELRGLSVEQPTLASGVYIVRVQNGKDVQHVRVVVEK